MQEMTGLNVGLPERDKQIIIDSIPNVNLKAFYPALHGRGATLIDRSQNAKNGTITGATWVRTPRGLWTLSFDGNDSVAIGKIYTIGSGDVALSLWVKFVAASQQVGSGYLIVNKAGFNGNFIKLLAPPPGATQGKIQLYNEAADGVAATFLTDTNYGDNVWHLVTATRTGTAGVIHVDDTESKSGTLVTGNCGGDTDWIIGSSGSASTSYVGLIGLPYVQGAVITQAQHRIRFTRERHLFGV